MRRWTISDYGVEDSIVGPSIFPGPNGEKGIKVVSTDDVIERLKKINQESLRPADFVASVRAFIHQLESQ